MKRFRKIIRRFFIIIIPLWLVIVCGLLILIYVTGTQHSDETVDVIVVLGAGVRSDGSPDLALTRRSEHGAALWLAGRAPYILCSGGFPENRPRSEAAACAEVLMNAGVPEEAIFLEERSRSTEENALYTDEMLQRENLQSVLLVTDTYHIFRATYLFNRHDMDVFSNPVLEMPDTSFYIRSVFREAAALHWQIFKDALGLPYTYVPLV